MGSKFEGSDIGKFSVDALILSFNGNKNITTGGGGAILSNDRDCVSNALHLSSTGRKGRNYDHDCVAYNYRMTNIQAALGVAQLEKLDSIIEKKKTIFNSYKFTLNQPSLSHFPTIRDRESSYWLSGRIIKNGDIENVIRYMNENGIEARLFWKPIHLQEPYWKCYKTKMDISNNLWRKVLILPSSTTLSEPQQKRVCNTIKGYFEVKSD